MRKPCIFIAILVVCLFAFAQENPPLISISKFMYGGSPNDGESKMIATGVYCYHKKDYYGWLFTEYTLYNYEYVADNVTVPARASGTYKGHIVWVTRAKLIPPDNVKKINFEPSYIRNIYLKIDENSHIEEIHVPKSVTNINVDVAESFQRDIVFYMESSNPPMEGFYYPSYYGKMYGKCIFIVPKGSVERYKNSKRFQNARIYTSVGEYRAEINGYNPPQTTSNTSINDTQYVDIGLPSGTKWKSTNENGYYTYEEAMRKYGKSLPSFDQLVELKDKCQWIWDSIKKGYKVVGPNGSSIFLPAAGFRNCDGNVKNVSSNGAYWSSSPQAPDYAWDLYFESGLVVANSFNRRCIGHSVRLVQQKGVAQPQSVVNNQAKAPAKAECNLQDVWVDLGLPSGTYWKSTNEDKLYFQLEAKKKFGSSLPTITQIEELKDMCKWIWDSYKKGYKVVGPNGNSIFLPAEGFKDNKLYINKKGLRGYYWSSSTQGQRNWFFYFVPGEVMIVNEDYIWSGYSVRLVQQKGVAQPQNTVNNQAKKPAKAEYNFPNGWVDLGLPSGTKWRSTNENGYYTYEEAMRKYGKSLPSFDQLVELMNKCTWKWDNDRKGCIVVGHNGNAIFLPAAGGYLRPNILDFEGSRCFYWTSELSDRRTGSAWYLDAHQDQYKVWAGCYDGCDKRFDCFSTRDTKYSVRLVK